MQLFCRIVRVYAKPKYILLKAWIKKKNENQTRFAAAYLYFNNIQLCMCRLQNENANQHSLQP